MYRLLQRSSGNVLGYHFTGRITEAEIKEVQREIQDAVQRNGEVRILMVLSDLGLPEAKAVWQDLKMTDVYLTDIERFAIVGDAAWHEWLTSITDTIAKGKAVFFDPEQLGAAWDWVEA